MAPIVSEVVFEAAVVKVKVAQLGCARRRFYGLQYSWELQLTASASVLKSTMLEQWAILTDGCLVAEIYAEKHILKHKFIFWSKNHRSARAKNAPLQALASWYLKNIAPSNLIFPTTCVIMMMAATRSGFPSNLIKLRRFQELDMQKRRHIPCTKRECGYISDRKHASSETELQGVREAAIR
ncbi:hypothetical protein Tco_1402995 [Tanacetum coccineum]